jgi:hypothetical protein
MSVLVRERKVIFTILILSIIVVMQSSVFAFESRQHFSAKGTIVYQGIGVYNDASCTNPLTSILWGNIHPGNTVTRTLYARNEALNDVTLFMNISNWTPVEASNHIAVTWNYDGTRIASNTSIRLELTLNVSHLITNIDAFSFTATISAMTSDT